MIALNDMEKSEAVAQKDFELFLKIISPFAPHVTSELWALCGHKTHIVTEKWPTYDPKKLIKQEVTVVIQINGKVRGEITVPSQSAESVVKEKALALEQIQKWVGSTEIRRVIYVQDKLLNIVI
jgi:leucyl-tRNA synthetase